MDYIDIDFFRDRIGKGADVKLLQYEHMAENICVDRINIVDALQTHFENKIGQNCVLINIEKDVDRYKSAVKELEKISINSFVHLKATYWKQRETFVTDLNFIVKFLAKFNNSIKENDITIDDFSYVSDDNIFIQDGPLACYCSHLRAMIYGYLNFSDFTIITEDDISITNTKYIQDYLKLIPSDWDVICMNSAPKNKAYEGNFYKFTDHFHSTHFYIIRNRSLEFIFKNMYPITDQVDVLLSNLFDQLNIYNIEDTVYQKSVSTNTQNNLHTIHTSPNYELVRTCLNKINTLTNYFTNKIIPNNVQNNTYIVRNILFDTLYLYIIGYENYTPIDDSIMEDCWKCETDFDKSEDKEKLRELFAPIVFVIQCCKKGINVKEIAFGILNNILNTINKFNKHNMIIDLLPNQPLHALGFGASANTYCTSDDDIVKIYNQKLRWINDIHKNQDEIFNREISILNKLKGTVLVPKLEYDFENKIIVLKNLGTSLYDNFYLPEDWKEQIKNIFAILSHNNIYYPEFKMNNILVRYGILSFVDYGLAEIRENADNQKNCEVFIDILDSFNKKFLTMPNHTMRLVTYTTFINNVKVHKLEKYVSNIF